MEFSQGRPLHLSVGDDLPDSALEFRHSSDAWLQSIETLSWNARRDAFHSLSGEDTSLRALKTLEIMKPDFCELCDNDSDVYQLFRCMEFPQLLSLTLNRVGFGYVDAITAPNLDSLHLIAIPIATHTLVTLLGGLPTLETLTLKYLNSSGFDDQPIPVGIELPRLRTLVTSGLGSGTRREILRSPRFPALRHWEYSDESQPLDEDQGETDRLLSAFLRECSSLDEVSLSCDYRLVVAMICCLDPSSDHEIIASAPAWRPVAAALRKLSVRVSYRYTTGADGVHKGEQNMVLDRLITVLQNRRERGIQPLESLMLSSCVASGDSIASLERNVGVLRIKNCGQSRCEVPDSHSS